MTGEPLRRTENAAQQWLGDHFSQMIKDLCGVLDLDAGLREIRIEQQHRMLDRDLRGMLDLDAGLREVMGSSTAKPTAELSLRSHLKAVLAVRTDPAVRNAVKLLAAVCAGIPTQQPPDREDVRAFNRVLDDAWPFDRYLDRHVVFALDRAFFLTHVINLALARDLARDLVGALDRDFNRFNRDFDDEDARILAVALDDARAFAGALERDLNLDRALIRALAGALADFVDHALKRMLSSQLPGINLLNLVPNEIGDLLDDFTHADLSDVDLSSTDLTGLRWSDMTRWPSPELADEIKKRSRETSQGSGVFVVVGAQGWTSDETHRV